MTYRTPISSVLAAILAMVFSMPICAREPLTLTSIEQENKMGSDAYKEILKKEKVSSDKALTEFVRHVAMQIAKAAPDKGFKYEVALLESDKINAFVLPGGKICVYTGILPFCQTEAGLATVLGHEVGHAILRHGGQRMTQQTVTGLVGKGFEKLLQVSEVSGLTSKVAMGAYGYGTKLGILLPYSRSHESEADEVGISYMAKAGYDPREAAEFWARFSTLKSKTPTFLSTHPSSFSRTQRLIELQGEALKLYDESPKYGRGKRLPAKYYREFPKQAAVANESKGTAKLDGKQAKNAETPQQPPTENDMREGLREAMRVASKIAIAQLSKSGGFSKDDNSKLEMPKALLAVEAGVRKAGKEKRIKQFLKSMNKAAEQIAGESKEAFSEAVGRLPFDDAKSLSIGTTSAATDYFKRVGQHGLRQKLLPLVQELAQKSGAMRSYRQMLRLAGPARKEVKGKFDLNSYLTDRVVERIFWKIASAEKLLRSRAGRLKNKKIRKVFGATASQ